MCMCAKGIEWVCQSFIDKVNNSVHMTVNVIHIETLRKRCVLKEMQ